MSDNVVFKLSTPLTRALVVVLTLAALLLGMFAMHSMLGSHSDASLPTGHTHADTDTQADPVAASTGGMALAAGADQGAVVPMVPCDESCAMGCALMAATCVIVFTLASLIFLARVPALLARVGRGSASGAAGAAREVPRVFAVVDGVVDQSHLIRL